MPRIVPTTALLVRGLLMVGLLGMAGCTKESTGFALPQGDVAAGKRVFVELRCNDCHSISDISMGTGEITSFLSLIPFFVLQPSRTDARCFVGKQQGIEEVWVWDQH